MYKCLKQNIARSSGGTVLIPKSMLSSTISKRHYSQTNVPYDLTSGSHWTGNIFFEIACEGFKTYADLISKDDHSTYD